METIALSLKVITAFVGTKLFLIAITFPDSNLILNLMAVLLLIVYGPRYIRVSRLKHQIEDLEHAYNVEKTAREVEHQELIGAQARADSEHEKTIRLEKDVSEWKARFDEQSKYTARPALEQIQKILEGNQAIFREIVDDNRALIALAAKKHNGGDEDEQLMAP